MLGEGIYTNDHAAQLYWADWLQRGFGPEPSAVKFGYPTGPQSVAVLAAQATGASLVSAFNGLLLAIPVLTALTALGGLAGLPALRRVPVAVARRASVSRRLVPGPERLQGDRDGAVRPRLRAADGDAQRYGRARAATVTAELGLLIGVGIILGLAAVFTFSVPGLAWFVIALVLWLAVEAVAGTSPVDWTAVRKGLAEHKLAIGATVLVLDRGGRRRLLARSRVRQQDRRRPVFSRSAELAGLSRARRWESGPPATSASSAERSLAR